MPTYSQQPECCLPIHNSECITQLKGCYRLKTNFSPLVVSQTSGVPNQWCPKPPRLNTACSTLVVSHTPQTKHCLFHSSRVPNSQTKHNLCALVVSQTTQTKHHLLQSSRVPNHPD